MSIADRLRSIGISEARLAQMGLVTAKATTAPDLATATADLLAWREWQAASPFDRMRVRERVGTDSISRGKALDQSLPNGNK